MTDVLIVGAGLTGLTIAEQAAWYGLNVHVIDERRHVGGNVHSAPDPVFGIDVHTYGSHIFHTSSAKVWEWAQRYTGWTRYTHRVRTTADGQVFSLPVNLHTINQAYGTELDPDGARALIEHETRGAVEEPTNLAEHAAAVIGPRLYELLIRHYTAKQWGTDPTLLPAATLARLPVRFTYDDRYFHDTWEGLPTNGYGAWTENIANSHDRMTVTLNTRYDPRRHDAALVVYTGPIDAFFNERHGPLGWRTLDLATETMFDVADYQGCPVMNNADPDTLYTRIHEYKHYRPDLHADTPGTVIQREYPRTATLADTPYYPIGTPADRERLLAYREDARDTPGVMFAGRLGTYQYLDMHMAIGHALSLFRNRIAPIFARRNLL